VLGSRLRGERDLDGNPPRTCRRLGADRAESFPVCADNSANRGLSGLSCSDQIYRISKARPQVQAWSVSTTVGLETRVQSLSSSMCLVKKNSCPSLGDPRLAHISARREMQPHAGVLTFIVKPLAASPRQSRGWRSRRLSPAPRANHPWHGPARLEVQKRGRKLAASAPRQSAHLRLD
jgi:hypothetical protein